MSLSDMKKIKDYLICVDSDGCAMDTMDIKHIQCFGPCMVQEWKLEAWEEMVLKRWNEINLYTMTRGINRFKGLAMALVEIDQKFTSIENIDTFSKWTDSAAELSNRSVEKEYEQTKNPIFYKALSWSKAVNASINVLPQDMVRPFSGAKEGLCLLHEKADIAVVSSANYDAVKEEWTKHGLLEHVDVLLCQDSGSKAYCIAELLKKGYEQDKVLMIGDAPGDLEAAKKNGIYYYPILVRREEESWKNVGSALEKLLGGQYHVYGQEKEKEFLDNLKGE